MKKLLYSIGLSLVISQSVLASAGGSEGWDVPPSLHTMPGKTFKGPKMSASDQRKYNMTVDTCKLKLVTTDTIVGFLRETPEFEALMETPDVPEVALPLAGLVDVTECAMEKAKVLRKDPNDARQLFATTDIHDCIGLVFDGENLGIMAHLRRAQISEDRGLLPKILAKFDDVEDKSSIKVTVTSAYYSPWLLKLLQILDTRGFTVSQKSIPLGYFCVSHNVITVEAGLMTMAEVERCRTTDDLVRLSDSKHAPQDKPRAVLYDFADGTNYYLANPATPGEVPDAAMKSRLLAGVLPYVRKS